MTARKPPPLTDEQKKALYPDLDTTPATPWITKSVAPAPEWFLKMQTLGQTEPVEKPCAAWLLQERTYGDQLETRVVPATLDEDGWVVPAVDEPQFRGAVYGG